MEKLQPVVDGAVVWVEWPLPLRDVFYLACRRTTVCRRFKEVS